MKLVCRRRSIGGSCLAPCGASGLKYRPAAQERRRHASRPLRGEWIEIAAVGRVVATHLRRLAPCGASGLKFRGSLPSSIWQSSRSLRGEWIEIVTGAKQIAPITSRSLRGEWIEIKISFCVLQHHCGLAPCGASGLKYTSPRELARPAPSRSLRGEWIEISTPVYLPSCSASRSLRGEWIEILRQDLVYAPSCCLAPCGASGLKYPRRAVADLDAQVSLLAGRVD